MQRESNSVPVAFMSYAHFDNERDKGRLSEFREQLSGEVRMQTGEEFPIFQDRNEIRWGQNWKERIDNAISEVTFLIPIITPSFFRSQHCRDELEKFLQHEKELGRNDLVLPLYYVDTPLLNDEMERTTDPLAEAIASHQFVDWRELRFEPFHSPVVSRRLAALAIQIRDALESKRLPPRSVKEQPSADLDSGRKGMLELASVGDGLLEVMNSIFPEFKKWIDKAIEERTKYYNATSSQERISSEILTTSYLNNAWKHLDSTLPQFNDVAATANECFTSIVDRRDPKNETDRQELLSLRRAASGLLAHIEPDFDTVRKLPGTFRKFGDISANTDRASKKLGQALEGMVSSLELVKATCEKTVQRIDEMLDGNSDHDSE